MVSSVNFNHIRDLVSNLGWIQEDQMFVPGPECLSTLEKLEQELVAEAAACRDVRICLHICGAVKDALIPIFSASKDPEIASAVTRVLVSLSLPVEYILPSQEPRTKTKFRKIKKQLRSAVLNVKKCFLNVSATLALATTLRETMLKSEKYNISLGNEECNHARDCLFLLRNILHLPEKQENEDLTQETFTELQSTQNKLIWNLFVQGIDGALLLMLNSKYRNNWTLPLALILATLYRNQSIDKVHQALETISSASESSEDGEESDGSKNSSTSLSSETSKAMEDFNDSGCPMTDELLNENTINVSAKLEKIQLSDDSHFRQKDLSEKSAAVEDGSESSSSCGSPYHKKRKGNTHETQIDDSAVSMECSSENQSKSSDDDIFDAKEMTKQFKAVQKLRCQQMINKNSESDSSNEEVKGRKLVKHRSHPPTGRRGKSPRRNNGCVPSICLRSAFETACTKGRVRYPLWEKRNSVSTLVDVTSSTPNQEDIGNLLKEFTLSFIHSGFSQLIVDIKGILLTGASGGFDKSLFYWLLGYFLHLSTTSRICLDHISDILSVDIICFLVFECCHVCENLELSQTSNESVTHYVHSLLNFIVIALKEILFTVDLYSRKSNSPKDRVFFNELSGKLAGIRGLHHIPLLLLRNCPRRNVQRYLEDVIVVNHQILIITGRGLTHCSEPHKINFLSHLKLFSFQKYVSLYSMVLEKFKTNSHFLNDCVFTMFHHLAGDVQSFELLFEPKVLRIFSEILKEEIELEQYQEDLIMYILNKFSVHMYQKSLEVGNDDVSLADTISGNASRSSCVSTNCLVTEDDDLFWWYLQFEQDEDPISRISEQIPTSKQDILYKLQEKNYITFEKHTQLKEKINDSTNSVQKNTFNQIPSNDDFTNLLRTVVQSGHRQHLIWLQDLLLETCFIKLGLSNYVAEPVPYYCIKTMLSVPLVPFTDEQQAIVQDKTFLALLQKLGLNISSETHPMYPRIPIFWTAEVLYGKAIRLGPIKKDKLKFSENHLASVQAKSKDIPVFLTPKSPPSPSCRIISSRMAAMKQTKTTYRNAENTAAS